MPASPFLIPPKLKDVAREISNAADTVIQAYRDERTSGEEDITSRLVQAIEAAIQPRGRQRRTSSPRSMIGWSAKVLKTSRGVAAEERRHGADLLAVTEIHAGGEIIAKGFLGQAKVAEPGAILSQHEWERLQSQVGLMLDLSPASFVMIYSKHYGVRFTPAIAIAGLRRRDCFDLNTLPLRQFFEWHFACFIGDRRLDVPHIRTLDDLRSSRLLGDLEFSNVLRITLRSK